MKKFFKAFTEAASSWLMYQLVNHFFLWLALLAAAMEHYGLCAAWVLFAFYDKLHDIKVAVEANRSEVTINNAIVQI